MYWAVRELHAWSALTSVALAGLNVLPGAMTDRRREAAARALLAILALQCVSGILLQVVYSPFTAGVRANVDIVLHDARLGHWNVLHPVLALATLTVAWHARGPARAGWRSAAGIIIGVTVGLALWFS